MLDFETARLEAELKALKSLEDASSQASLWMWNGWTLMHNEAPGQTQFLKQLEDAYTRVEACEAERKKLISALEAKLKTPAPTKRATKQAAVKPPAPTQAKKIVKTKRR